jgi:hypothetical protein
VIEGRHGRPINGIPAWRGLRQPLPDRHPSRHPPEQQKLS